MPVCVPIKDLKDTATFVETVRANDAVIVTRNGYDAFAALPMEEYNALIRERLRWKRAEDELVALVDEAEADIEAGRVVDGDESMRMVRERYGL